METVDIHQVLKDLALNFDVSGDPVVFVKIILKVHNLLKYQIRRIRRRKPYLCRVDFDDLYQTAVIGLYRAVAKVKVDEPGGKLIYNIRRYVDNEILKDYKDRSSCRLTIPFEIVQQELVDTTKVYVDLEREFIRDRFYKLIADGVISQEEFDMIHCYYVKDMSYKDIASQVGSSADTISKRVRDALNRIRWEFRRRNWEEE